MSRWFGPVGDCSCCGDVSSSSSSLSSSSSPSSSSSSSTVAPCLFCSLEGPFGRIRGVIEISGFPATLEYGAFGDAAITEGLNGRNGTYTVDIPLIDGCPTPAFTNSPTAPFGFVGSASVEGDWSSYYGITEKPNHFLSLVTNKSRDERVRAVATVESGKLFISIRFGFANQVGSAFPNYGPYSGIDDGIDPTRDPFRSVDVDDINLCDEVSTGFEYQYTLFDGVARVTVVGYMEILLV